MTLELNASDDRGIDIVKQVFAITKPMLLFRFSLLLSQEIKDFAGTRTIFGSRLVFAHADIPDLNSK